MIQFKIGNKVFRFGRIPNPLNPTDLRKIKKEIKAVRRWNRKQWIFFLSRAAMVVAGLVVLTFIWYAKDLPTPNGIRRHLGTEETTNIYDRTGEHLLYAISGQQRRLSIPFSEMPDYVKHATVSIEDKSFYKHNGIDFKGLARAIYKDITRGKSEGGSTITQQLVKNAIIGSNKKAVSRKIKEAILSIEIEAMYPKDKILELYLNEIPYGGNAYGVEAASETFFGKKAKDLTLDEAATLAAIPQAPSYYSPYGTHVDDLVKRRNLVLTQMVKEGFITQDDADKAKTAKLVTIPRRDTILAPHFVMYVRDIIAEKYGEDIFSKGLNITTTLDIEQQRNAEAAVADGAAKNKDKYGITNAALVALNPKNGEVLAMVGSADYFNNEINGQFNVTTAERQPGSAFKPLVYATALKEKFNPASIFFDLPTDFGKYKPSNFDGRSRGPVTMREALGQSLNIPAVKTLALVGLKEAIKTATDLGITTLTKPDNYGLSLVLGAAEVKPIELAQAYGTFANGGVKQDIAPILKIQQKDGKVLEEYKSEDHKKQVIDPQIAYQMSDMMADQNAKAPVFGSLLSFSGRQVASKTGTTNGITNGQSDVRDAWTVGYTPSLVTAIWVGNNDHSPLGKGVLAANAAVPIFRQYMDAALRSLAKEAFFRPNGIQTITVDRLSNKLPGDASPPDQRITDIFASWQVPTKTDDIHVKVKLCKGTDLLANDETPADETEEKFFVNVHSERPNDPNWEGPVRSWADSNGFTNRPPTGKCDKFTSENRPQISISQPVNGATVSGGFAIEAAASAQYGVSQVEFFIDGQSINVDEGAPYTSSYDAKNLSNGVHTLVAEAKDPYGRSSRATISITVSKESTPPSDVVGPTAIPGKGLAQLNWINPSDSDLSRVRIYISSTAGELGLRYSTEPTVTPSSPSSLSVGGLTSDHTYYFTLRPVDTDNNENQSTTQVSAIIQ
jgi:1A family penicillin-binding protein